MQLSIKKYSLIVVFIALISAIIGLNSCINNHHKKETVVAIDTSADLKTNMRKLWADHIIWTRNVILCIVDDLPGKEEAVKRLLQNQVDIGNAFKPYYGDDAGNEFTKLLTPHITISAEVVLAAKNDDLKALELAKTRWYANADEIVVFLNRINPNWKVDHMKMMFYDHLKLAADEATNRIEKDYVADVAGFDKIHSEILIMADMFTNDIVKQFPEKFSTKNHKHIAQEKM